jgi:hypothetical protein
VWVVAVAAPLQAAAGVAVVVHRPSAPRLAVGAPDGDRLPAPRGATAARPTIPPATLPLGLDIPSIGVATSLVRLGLGNDGSLEVPGDFGVAGWWTGGSVPGEPGPAVMVGHLDSVRAAAVFYRLHELGPGDPVLIHRSDGSVVRFEVETVRQFPKDQLPTDTVYGPTPEPTLRLITCGGSFDRAQHSYRDNVVVFARLVPAVDGPDGSSPAA